jgi:hypothetical protein
MGKRPNAFLAVVLIEPPLSSARTGRLCFTESRTTKREARKVDIAATVASERCGEYK